MMRLRQGLAIALMGAVLVAATSSLAVRVDHFQARPAETLAGAIVNFHEANRELERLLGGKLGDEEMIAIHELTYTLEVALKRIDDDLDSLADVLEELHLASENAERDRVNERGNAYLTVTRELSALSE